MGNSENSKPAVIDAAIQLRVRLAERNQKLVLAESCTAGRMAASLGALPGISAYLCGSFVVYRNSSKRDWLDIDSQLLDDPGIGPVSPEVTSLLAQASLQKTLEADLAFAITGDVGPGAPAETDGKIFCFIIRRSDRLHQARSFQLVQHAPRDENDWAARLRRLDEATQLGLKAIGDFLVEFGA